jgi:xylulokinase
VAASLVAGVDCSTQSTKVVVVDVESGREVARGHAAHSVHHDGGASETDPRIWWDALGQALEATGAAGSVAAIAVGGQQHGLVVLGAEGEPLRPAILWNDTRSAPDAADLVAGFGPGWWATEIGSVPLAAFTVTSWAWLRRVEPGTAGRAAALRLPHDWLTERLCGEAVTDRGDASGTGWWSVPQGRYHPAVLEHERVRIDPDWLPRVLGPSAPAGEIAGGLDRLALPAGAMVGPGTGDNMAAALGLALDPGTAVVSLGTSGTAYAVTGEPAADPTGVVAGFADASGRYLPLACTLNATLAVERVAAWLGLDRDDIAPDSGTVVVLPFLDGERTPDLPTATGSILGLTHRTTRQQVLRAAYEGAVVSLLDALDRIEGAGDPASPIVLIGGGARSTAWQDVVARLSGRSVEVPAAPELVALGAAAQAAACLTGEDPLQVARRFGGRRGTELDPVTRDEAVLERHHRARSLVHGV